MKRLFTSLGTSAWRHVLALIWWAQPWFVSVLLAQMVPGGLVPAARIQVTSAIIQSTSHAIQAGRHPQGLVNSALLFGFTSSTSAQFLFSGRIGAGDSTDVPVCNS